MIEILTTAVCRICGERVTLIEAPLHIEDHRQAGELPTTVNPPVLTGEES